MYKYKCLNSISPFGIDEFTKDYTETEDLKQADAVLVRSASMLDMEIPCNVLAIARAGAGVNNIPLDKCAEEGIVVFNTPGANANGVKELVIAGMLLASRDITGGINWVIENKEDPEIAKKVEKEKAKFAGCELKGKKLGVIGLGAIGVLVANAANRLGMEVYGCDPFISVDNAWVLSRDVSHVKSREEIYSECDYITVHPPLIKSDDPVSNTYQMINAEAINKMKKGVILLNFARDLLVDDDAMEKALESGKIAKYVTDFPNERTVKMKNVIAIPHLGASTAESEDNCAFMAVEEIMSYLEKGTIKNSVNYPNLDAGNILSASRITILHKNIPNMLSQFTSIVSEKNINIENLLNKSRGDYAYTVLDSESKVSDETVKRLMSIEGVLKVRVIA